MTEPNTPASTVPAAVEPTTTGDPAPAPAATAPTTSDTVTLTPAELQAQLDDAATKASQKANREAENLRKRLKEIDDAALTEAERAQQEAQAATARADKLEAEAKQSRTETAVERAAREAGFTDPTDAIALAAGRIEFDDAGQPVNAVDVVKSIAEAKPHLISTPPTPAPGATATNPARGAGEPPKSDAEKFADLKSRAAGTANGWGGGGVRTY